MYAHVATIAAAFPLDPPIDWFTTLPDWFAPNQKLTVIESGPEAGRVAGTVAPRDVCILDDSGVCWTPTDSPTGYREAMQGDTPTADGTVIATATLAADIGHAPEWMTFSQAVNAMAHTGMALARVQFHDVDGYGTVALGAAWPDLSDLQIRKMQASALSGDWRYRIERGFYDMAGAVFVNNPGEPLPNRPVFQPMVLAASCSAHPVIVGGWKSSDEEVSMFCSRCGHPVANVGGQVSSGAVSSGTVCACGSHAAASGPLVAQPMPETPAAPAADMVTREEFDALAARLEELTAVVAGLGERVDGIEGWLTDQMMGEVDAMAAAAALPPRAARTFTQDERDALRERGLAMADGDFPIPDCASVRDAISSMGRSDKDPAAIKAHIISAAKQLDCVSELPPDWVEQSTQVG